jgi:hypothetical protein
MYRCSVATLLFLVVWVGNTNAGEVELKGTLKRVDQQAMSVTVLIGSQEVTFRVTPDTTIIDAATNKVFQAGLDSKALREGVPVVLTLDRIDKREVVTKIKVGR